MRPGDRDLVAFLEEEVLPYLSVEALYSDVAFTSRGGRYWRGPCPLHGGKDPNFSVDTVTKGWTCFSRCGSGSAVAFINDGTKPTGPDFVEAVKKLAALAGVPFPERERTPEEVKKAEERDRRESLLRSFLAHVQSNLSGDAGKAARAYLDGRGLSGPGLEDLGLYTTRAETSAALTSKGFSAAEVEASGLLHDGRWEGRLIIPWRDRWGRLGTFAARDLSGKAEEAEKYLYMTTKGWAKGKAELVAFGLDQALSNRADLVLVEGLLDVVNLQARGFPNVAAIGGGGHELRPERWEALASFDVRSAVLVLDNDQSKAGLEGTLAAVENLRKVRNSRNVRNVPDLYVVDPVHLGDCKDPDEVVRRHGDEAFLAALDKREPAALFVGRQRLKDVTPESPVHEREEAAAKVAAYAGELQGERSALHVEELLRLAAEKTGYSPAALADVAKSYEERRRREEGERLMDKALREAAKARSEGKEPLDVAAELMGTISSMKAQAVDEPPAFSVDRLEQESRELAAGRPSGWEALDRQEVFFNPGELALLAGRTGHAKTTVLVGLLVNWAKAAEKDGRDELLVFYSQEEAEVRIYHRLRSLLTAASGSGWTANEVKDFLRGGPGSRGKGYVWNGTEDALNKARETLRKWENRLLVVHRSSWTVEDIEAHARKVAAQYNVGAVLLDYLQRISPPEARYDRRDIEVSTVARRLKALAVDLSVPVVCGAQLNREAVPEKYREHIAKHKSYEEAKSEIKKARPDLYHLREGGAEQEADLVLGLLNYAADWRTDEDTDRRLPEVTRLEVGTLKNRYGTPGRWAALAFEGRFNLIRDPYGDEV